MPRKRGRQAPVVVDPPARLPVTPEYLSPEQFEQILKAENIRAALEAEAVRMGAPDNENAAGDAIVAALETLKGYDFAKYGVEGIARWLHGILRRRMSFVWRRTRLEERRIDGVAERRWSQLNGAMERAVLGDIEMVAEARAKFRLAPLTAEETACFAGRLNGESLAATATRLRISVSTVKRRNSMALKKIRAVPSELALSPDLDYYIFRLCSDVNLYHAIPKMGSRLDREKLARMK